MTPISGNTYPVKDQLKALGARWDAAQKVWMVADEVAQKAREIVAGASSATSRPPAKPASPWAEKKYQVRVKPVHKYAPLFAADTIDEVVAWMDTHMQWRYCGTGTMFQCRADGTLRDLAVCTAQRRLNASGEYFVALWAPCPEDYDLCHRVTPGQSVGMGAS